jgi:hypothetical protein
LDAALGGGDTPQTRTADGGLDIRLPSFQANPAQPGGLGTVQGHVGDMPVLELTPMDNGQGAVVGGKMRAVVAVIKVVVVDHDGVIVPAERTPAEIIVAMVPMDPGRPPGMMGNPVPAQTQSPVPPAIVVDGPAPALIGNPGPAARRIPVPVSIVIRTPIVIVNGRHPNIPVRPLVNPRTIVGQLFFIIIQVRRQILSRDILAVQAVPLLIEIIELVAPVRRRPLGAQPTVRGCDLFPVGDDLGAALTGSFDRAFERRQLGFGVPPDVQSVEARLENIKRGIRRVELEALFGLEGIDAQINIPGQNMEHGPVVSAPGQVGELNLCPLIDAEVIFQAELDFDPSVTRDQLIAFDQGEVHGRRLGAEVAGPLDNGVAFDVGHPGKAVAVIVFALRRQGDRPNESCRQKQPRDLSHLLSPCQPFYSKPCANPFTLRRGVCRAKNVL